MGLVFPRYDIDVASALPAGAEMVTTREVTVSLEKIPFGEKVALATGTRLRHVKSEYAAECIPNIEYAHVYFEVLTGVLAGRLVAILTFEMNAPVPVRQCLEAEHGLVARLEDEDPQDRPAASMSETR